jgi:hypothetical protein
MESSGTRLTSSRSKWKYGVARLRRGSSFLAREKEDGSASRVENGRKRYVANLRLLTPPRVPLEIAPIVLDAPDLAFLLLLQLLNALKCVVAGAGVVSRSGLDGDGILPRKGNYLSDDERCDLAVGSSAEASGDETSLDPRGNDAAGGREKG